MSMQIFHNGQFVSCEDQNKEFSVLIEDKGKIIFTGDKVPEEYIGIKKITDLNGKCVVPSFGDTHMHFTSFAMFYSTIDVRKATNFDELSDVINDYIKKNPKEKNILAFGSSAHTVKEKRLPDREVLDKITSLPLMIVKYDGHAAVANSALIKMFPSDVTDDLGFQDETGWLYQNAFYKATEYLTKSISINQVIKGLSTAANYLANQGIGLVHAVEGVGFPRDMDIDMIRRVSLALPQDFRVYFQTMDVKKVTKRKMSRIGGCFKNAVDGCFGSEDAALKQPYTNNPENKGVLFYTQEKVNEFVKEANRAELQVAMHAIGDAAVEQAITAYETALKDFPRSDHRHIIIHADLIPEELLERAAKINIHLAVQTPFVDWNEEPMEYIESILGDRADNLIPIKSMLDHGLTIANGSDAPCTLPNPVKAMHAACNHPNPNQRIDALQALRMVTIDAARLSFDENEMGTLTIGKRANFVILSQNPLNTQIEKIDTIKVEGLYLDGKKYKSKTHSTGNVLLNTVINRIKGEKLS